jgi:Protein of unknown function (DUF3800)
MKIFIDESGAFSAPTGGKSSISSVGTLCMPSQNYDSIVRGFTELTKHWPKEINGEIKGKNLDEAKVAQIIPLLKSADCIFEIAAVDISNDTTAEMQAHKQKQAKGLIENINDSFHPNMIEHTHKLKASLLKLPDNLYVQTVLTNEVVFKTLNHSILYYCQRKPTELGVFEWIVDAKDSHGITPYEQWWKDTVSPLLQSRSILFPGIRVVDPDFDYSYFDKSFLMPMPAYLTAVLPTSKKDGKATYNLGKLLTANLKFDVSENHIGLQLVDILTNTINRALKGNFSEAGWLPLAGLMIRGSNKLNVSFLTFGEAKIMPDAQKYILKTLARAGNSMNNSGKK